MYFTMRARPLSLAKAVPSAERIQEHQKAASPPPKHVYLVGKEVGISASAVSEVPGCLLLALVRLVGWFQVGGFLQKGGYLFDTLLSIVQFLDCVFDCNAEL